MAENLADNARLLLSRPGARTQIESACTKCRNRLLKDPFTADLRPTVSGVRAPSPVNPNYAQNIPKTAERLSLPFG